MSKARRQSNEELESRLDSLESEAVVYQKKTLSTNISVTNADVADLRFNNLEVGKTYRVSVYFRCDVSGGSSADATLTLVNGVTTILVPEFQTIPNTQPQSIPRIGYSDIFVASATSLVAAASVGASAVIQAGTWVMLEELPRHQSTTKWS